jgi:hypothetical protein
MLHGPNLLVSAEKGYFLVRMDLNRIKTKGFYSNCIDAVPYLVLHNDLSRGTELQVLYELEEIHRIFQLDTHLLMKDLQINLKPEDCELNLFDYIYRKAKLLPKLRDVVYASTIA